MALCWMEEGAGEKGGRVAQAAEAEGKNKSLEMRFPKAARK